MVVPARLRPRHHPTLSDTGDMEPLHVPAGHMSARQVADTLGIGLSGVRELRRRGRLVRAGGSERQPYYDSEQVLVLLAARVAA